MNKAFQHLRRHRTAKGKMAQAHDARKPFCLILMAYSHGSLSQRIILAYYLGALTWRFNMAHEPERRSERSWPRDRSTLRIAHRPEKAGKDKLSGIPLGKALLPRSCNFRYFEVQFWELCLLRPREPHILPHVDV